MICWITGTIGTGPWDETEATEKRQKVDVRTLLDRRGNDDRLLEAKVEEALEALRSGRQVVICCDYGISRSNAVAAAVLAIQRAVDFDTAVRQVIDATGAPAIQLDVLAAARRVVERRTPSSAPTEREGTLILGGSGFLGRPLAAALAQEHSVVAPSHDAVDLLRDSVKLDLLVRQSNVRRILHLAHPHVVTTTESLGHSLIMLKNVLDVCTAHHIHLVYVSGWEVFSGYIADALIADSRLSPRPGSTYGMSKVLGEQLIAMAVADRSFPATIVRCSPVYGPLGDRPKFIWHFIEKAFRGEELGYHRYVNGPPKLDLLFHSDAVAALARVVDRRVEGTVHIGSGRAVSTAEIAEWIVARVGKGWAAPVDIGAHASNILMNIEPAKTLLDWTPKVPWEEGLAAMVAAAAERHS